MIFTLLSHQWKAFWRSKNAGKSVAIQIVIGFFVLYILAIAIFIGFSLNSILQHLFPRQDEITVFCGLLFYYFAVDFVLRFMLQDLPTISVAPYLQLNISKKSIAQFLNIKSLFSVFNIFPIILFAPFIAKEVGSTYSCGTALAFIITTIGITIFNHFLLLYLKRKTILNSTWMVAFFIVVVLFAIADHFSLFSLREISVKVFLYVLHHQWTVVVPVILAVAAFFNNNNFVLKNLYIDSDTKRTKEKETIEYSWLTRFGKIGELIALEVKLIIRNKRPRSLLFLSLIFLGYGFMFFKPIYIDKNMLGMLLFGSTFITGMFVITYGQFLFAWQSSSFDGLMVGSSDIKDYIKAKFAFMNIYSTLALLISLLYGFISWKIIPVLFAGYFFNIGITPVITGYFATLHYKALDLSKSSTFNYQGISAVQYLFSVIIMLIGFLLYFPLGFFINPWAGIISVGLIGIIFYVLRDKLIGLIYKNFLKNKYKILEGFREK
ncbi:MAG: DUF5687 family protein [Arachidicoccus sp.]|nr:DUF5687 family protein [Arachidicoccus sp.]